MISLLTNEWNIQYHKIEHISTFVCEATSVAKTKVVRYNEMKQLFARIELFKDKTPFYYQTDLVHSNGIYDSSESKIYLGVRGATITIECNYRPLYIRAALWIYFMYVWDIKDSFEKIIVLITDNGVYMYRGIVTVDEYYS